LTLPNPMASARQRVNATAAARRALAISSSLQPFQRRYYSLTRHPNFANTTTEEAGRHLGLFASDCSEWRARGLPWRLYRPGVFFGGRCEISTLEALDRLSNNQPVRFQRCRIVTVTPDMKALEGLATTIAAPALRGISRASQQTKDIVKADPTGFELSHGQPTTLCSLAELKLFSCIYNLEVELPSTDSGQDQGSETLRIAHLISKLMNRELASGLETFSVENSLAKRFLWYFQRDLAFWLPAALILVTPTLASETVMTAFGLEAMKMFPFSTFASLSQYVQTLPAVIEETVNSGLQGSSGVSTADLAGRLCSYSVNIAGLFGMGMASLRALWKTIFDATPMGYKITAYDAFLRIARGEPVVLQQMAMHTFRVPFITTISFFTPYRPGDVVSNLEDLAAFANIHRKGSK